MSRRNWISPTLVAGVIGLTLLLTGCGGGGDSGAASQGLPPAQSANSSNGAPTISGTPPSQVEAGASYAFTPAASDPDFDFLSFGISNKPSWADFNSQTGALTGDPSQADVGVYRNVRIFASDGLLSGWLPPFSITVTGSQLPPEEPDDSGTLPSYLEWGVLGEGARIYVDHADDFSEVPAEFVGLSFLKTGNDDKFQTAADFITFEIQSPMVVYVAYDDAIGGLPGWLGPWENTGYKWRSVWASYSVYQLEFPAGTVVLGGNELGFHHYSVAIVDPADAPAPLAPPEPVEPPPEPVEPPPEPVEPPEPQTGAATLNWSAPTADADGSSLTGLAGFRVFYSQQLGQYDESLVISNPTVTTAVIDDLTSGTWFFQVAAVDDAGNLSELSNAASKTIP